MLSARLAFLRKKLRKASNQFELTKVGRRMYVHGNTYYIKDDLKRYGAKWDRDERAWWFSSQKWKLYEDEIRAILYPSAAPAQTFQDKDLASGFRVVFRDGMAFLKGNTYPIKDNLKHLGFRWNGQSKMWVVPERNWSRVEQKVVSLIGKAGQRPSHSNNKALLVIKAMRLVQRLGYGGWLDSDYGQGSSPPSQREVEEMSEADLRYMIKSLRSEY